MECSNCGEFYDDECQCGLCENCRNCKDCGYAVDNYNQCEYPSRQQNDKKS